MACAQLLFVVNIVHTVRGVAPRETRGRNTAAEALTVLAALVFAAGMFGVGILVGRATKSSSSQAATAGASTVGATTAEATTAGATTAASSQQTTTQAPSSGGGGTGGGGALAAGKQVFETAGCTSCHTLKAANATGTVGPNLDQKKPPKALVVDRVTHGKGAMPSFQGRLSAKQIQDVAEFVSKSAGGG
jgi:mono/diheme cytochrome c family protein